MRIISGSHKGRRLTAPKKLPVRPTTDRSKEALFNILQHQYDWKNTAVLDLFSGTGSISYEFGSRGVKNIIAVDQNKMCVDFIRKTSEIFKTLHSSNTDGHLEVPVYCKNAIRFDFCRPAIRFGNPTVP
jgi:16S rRNA (guanine(966)-N(2))-methyltransferase RsmD